MELVEYIRNKVELRKFPHRNSVLIVAVSGGVDSVVLLHLLLPLAGYYDWELIIAHLNHSLRQAANADAKFVSSLAKSLGLKFVTKKVAVSKLAKQQKLTLEEAGRKARYAFLRNMAEKYKAEAIVTAHTSDDQIETVLMNLLRGAAVRGLSGMQELESNIWRPLLGLSKERLFEFAQKYGLKYKEDKSNKDLNYTRNRIRHLLIPALAQISPGVSKVILRNAEVCTDLKNFLDDYIQQAYDKVLTKATKDSISLCRYAFGKLHPFIQNEILLYVIKILQGDRQDFKKIHLQEMIKVIRGSKKKTYKQLPAKLFLIKTCDTITISRYRPKNL